jgi:hypothetical protein
LFSQHAVILADVDIVVLAVGFDLIAGYPGALGMDSASYSSRPLPSPPYLTRIPQYDMDAGFPVYGETGVALDERWRGDPTAYYGILVPGYPNLFCLSGPNTGLGHNSLLLMLECQVWGADDLRKRTTGKVKRV